MSDPFRVLGLRTDATADDVRAARRELARSLHPDAGGDASAMQAVNVAAGEALRIIAAPVDPPTPPAPSSPVPERAPDWVSDQRDIPSFTVEALPAVAFEALVLAAAELGEVEDDDPPYRLDVLMVDPLACWCVLDVVPDAGASTVSITIARAEPHPPVSLIDVRNSWISALNALDWSAL